MNREPDLVVQLPSPILTRDTALGATVHRMAYEIIAQSFLIAAGFLLAAACVMMRKFEYLPLLSLSSLAGYGHWRATLANREGWRALTMGFGLAAYVFVALNVMF